MCFCCPLVDKTVDSCVWMNVFSSHWHDIWYAKFAKIYKKQCKNCGKEINVTKKNINYCSELCKREFKRKQQHEYYEKYKV